MQASTIRSATLALAALINLGSAVASPSTVYADDYDGNQTLASGVSGSYGPSTFGTATGPYAGSNGKSWGGNVLVNTSGGNPAGMTTINLNGLVAHTQITLDFMLGFLNSWDSTNGSPSPDYFDIFVDSVQIGQLTTGTASGSVAFYGGGTLVVDNGQIDTDQFYSDDLVDMGTAGFLTFAHSASSITIGFRASGAGWQGGPDEYWGIDSIRVIADGADGRVPEPTPLALLGLAALVAAVRRRRPQAEAD